MHVPSQRSRKRGLKIVAAIAVLSIVVVYSLVARMSYDALSLPGESFPPATPGGSYQVVAFPARDRAYTVYGFLLRAEQAGAPALISVHGYRRSRLDEYHLNRAVWLRDLGYDVLSIDLSDNGGQTIGDGRISLGFAERQDVLGAYDYLLAQGYAPGRIGLVGESMGGVTSLQAAAQEPRIRAVWSDSAFTRADTLTGERLESSGLSRILIPGAAIWGWLLTGDRIWEVAPLEAGPTFAANKQAVYLVHCEQDASVSFHHALDLKAAYQAAGVDVALWAVPGGEHTSAIVDHREDYLQKLDTFFRAHLN
jgi:dipeptidyl aminopeptidase/acylaminoacyl peptidase